MKDEIQWELTKRIGASQECGQKGFALDASKLIKKQDWLSLFLRDAIGHADHPSHVRDEIQYAIKELKDAELAASEYGDELDSKEETRLDMGDMITELADAKRFRG